MASLNRFASTLTACSLAFGGLGVLELNSREANAQFGRPITIAVKKVKDNAGASWFRKSYEEKLATMLSTELTNSGHFTVLAREDDALKAIQEEMNMAGINKNTAVKKNNLTQFAPENSVWRNVRDAIDATVAVLHYAGWTPHSPCRWTAPQTRSHPDAL